MKIEVGKTYRDRLGNEYTIRASPDADYPFSAEEKGAVSWTVYGRYYLLELESHYDLIEEVIAIPAGEATEIQSTPGRKDDGDKLDVTLFFDDLPHAIEAVTEVLQWAITKKQPQPYERGSWQGVDDFQRRYRAALLRHTLNAAKAEKAEPVPFGFSGQRDHETGLLELAHIATDAMFMLEMAVRAQRGIA